MRMNTLHSAWDSSFHMSGVYDQFVPVLCTYNIFSPGDRKGIWTHNMGELSLVLCNDIIYLQLLQECHPQHLRTCDIKWHVGLLHRLEGRQARQSSKPKPAVWAGQPGLGMASQCEGSPHLTHGRECQEDQQGAGPAAVALTVGRLAMSVRVKPGEG